MDIHNTVKNKEKKYWPPALLSFYQNYIAPDSLKKEDQNP